MTNIEIVRSKIEAATIPAEIKQRAYDMLDKIAASDLYHEDGWNDTETVQHQGNASDMSAVISAVLQGKDRAVAVSTHTNMARAGRLFDFLAS